MQSIVSKSQCAVLVVEDEALIRMAATSLVEETGFIVLEAASADEAIVLLEAHSEIRVIFTDIQMAGSMDGLELINYAHNRWPPLRFIVVSGEKTPSNSDMPSGSRFFHKPYDMTQIANVLREMMTA